MAAIPAASIARERRVRAYNRRDLRPVRGAAIHRPIRAAGEAGRPCAPRSGRLPAAVQGATRAVRLMRDDRSVELAMPARFVTTNSSAVLSAGLDGLGIVQLAEFVASHHLASGALVRVLPGWRYPSLPLHLVTPTTRKRAARVQAFMDGHTPCWCGGWGHTWKRGRRDHPLASRLFRLRRGRSSRILWLAQYANSHHCCDQRNRSGNKGRRLEGFHECATRGGDQSRTDLIRQGF
jgi:hypothetical protein